MTVTKKIIIAGKKDSRFRTSPVSSRDCSEEMMKCYNLTVTGNVQDIGFSGSEMNGSKIKVSR